MTLAPIVLFVYNRPDHTKKTLDALSKNEWACDSELYIFSDGPKNVDQDEKVKQTRELINSNGYKDKFKSYSVLESVHNKGLAASIIMGVNTIFESFENVIVLEDDLVTSNSFLRFMNSALDFYRSNKKIGSISGYSPVILNDIISESDVYFTPRNCSIGWATWKHVWSHIDWDMKAYQIFSKSLRARFKFNRYGLDRATRLDNHMLGKTHSWSIRFGYYLVFHDLLVVYPKQSLLKHIGWDGSGTNTSEINKQYELYNSEVSTDIKYFNFSKQVFESQEAKYKFRKIYSGSILQQFKLILKTVFNRYV